MKAVIFDLDGVIVSTDDFHYLAWKQLADREDIPFDRVINKRLLGVSRMESLSILLEKANKSYSEDQMLAMADWKNDLYRGNLAMLTPQDILPGVRTALNCLKAGKIPVAIGSSSRNAPTILERIGFSDAFQAVVSGNDINKSKPDPEVFLLAAEKLGIPPRDCLVVEDAVAGVTAALSAGMKVLAVGAAFSDSRADYRAKNLECFSFSDLMEFSHGESK